MKNSLKLLSFIFVSSLVLAQVSGLPIPAFSGGSGGDSFWVDAGVSALALPDGTIRPTRALTTMPDAGPLRVVTGQSSGTTTFPALSVTSLTAYQPRLTFDGPYGLSDFQSYGTIFGSSYGGLNQDFGLNLRSSSNISFSWAEDQNFTETRFGRFDATSRGFVSNTPANYYAFALNDNNSTGARIKLSPPNNLGADYLYSTQNNGTSRLHAGGIMNIDSALVVGNSTIANLPSASVVGSGGIIYNLDAGALYYSDGTAWNALGSGSGGGGSSGAYWYDGGAGLITATEDIIKYGAGANFSEDPNTTGQALTLQHTGGTTMFPRIIWKDGLGVPVADIGSSSFNGYTAYTGLVIRVHKNGNVPIRFGNTTLPIYGSSGPFLGGYAYGDFGGSAAPYGLALYAQPADNALSLANGGRLDFGSGTIDYAQSNGGGITSPGTWTSTLAFASGVGVTAPRVQASGGALSSYTSANAGTGGVGALSFDTTMQAMKVQQTSSSFSPIAQPHLIYDAQTYSTRVTGPELAAPPEIAERVKVSTTATLQMYWTYTAGTVTTVGGKPMYPLVVAGNALGYGMTASSAAASTIQRITQSQYRPMWCQRVRTDVVTDALIFGGLSSAAPVAGGITAQTGTFAYLYYEAGNARWQLCTRDGVAAATCANTASVAASTSYLLCLRVTTTSVDALVDGVHVGSTSTNLPPSGTGLAPVIAMEAVNTAHTLYIGPMQVESY